MIAKCAQEDVETLNNLLNNNNNIWSIKYHTFHSESFIFEKKKHLNTATKKNFSYIHVIK